MAIEIEAHDFRVERPNEVARHFDRALVEVNDNGLLIIKDADDASVLAIYGAEWWEAVIFGADHSS